jgi:putative ABC transport system permease protein
VNPWPLIRADLARSRLGVAIVVVVVALAVALGVTLSAAERGVRRGSADAAAAFDLVIGMPGSAAQLVLTTVYLQPAALPLLPGEVLARLGGEPGIAWAAPIGFGDNWRGMPIVGTTAEFATRGGRLPLAQGRPFAALGEAVVGASVGLDIGAPIEPAHGIHGRAREARDDEEDGRGHGGVEYRVVGRMRPTGTPWDRAILVPIETVWQIHALGTGHAEDSTRIGPPWEARDVPGVPAIVVKPESVASAYALRARYRSGGTAAVFPAEVLVELYGILGNLRDLVTALALATQVLVGIAILLAVAAALATRRRSLAVLRAIGAPREFLFTVVWGELVLIIGAGSFLGLALGYAAAFALAAWMDLATGIAAPVTLAWREVGLAVGLVVVGSLLAAVPAASAYRRPPAIDLKR